VDFIYNTYIIFDFSVTQCAFMGAMRLFRLIASTMKISVYGSLCKHTGRTKHNL